MFEVIKNIEMPEVTRRPRVAIYPYTLLDVGDGFETPDDMGTRLSGKSARLLAVRCSGYAWAKRHNPTAKFRTAKVGDKILCKRIA